MPRHIWTVLCSQRIFNEETKNVSLIEVIEEIGLSQQSTETIAVDGSTRISGPPFPLYLVSLVERTKKEEPEIFRIRLRLEGPDGRSDNPVPDGFEVRLPTRRTRLSNVIAGLPWFGYGDYSLLVELIERDSRSWRLVANVPLWVRLESEDAPG